MIEASEKRKQAARRPPPGRSLAEAAPALAREWHRSRNAPLRPTNVFPKSNRRVWWQCRVGSCRHEWQVAPCDRVQSETGCPACAGKVATARTSLAARYPALAREWHPTANRPIRPQELLPGSDKIVWWRCSKRKCRHEWKRAVKSRTGHASASVPASGCPACARRVATPKTCLATCRPDVATQWHPTRNRGRTPEHVLPGSNLRVWWQCDVPSCSHEWQAAVMDRTRTRPGRRAGGNGCPACSGRVASSGNNLARTHPEVAREWHPTRNGQLRPADVTPASGRRVWWRCRHRACSHEWEAVIANRTSHGTGCPDCANRVATPRTSLASLRPDVAREWHPTANPGRTPDQVRPGSNLRVAWRCLTCGSTYYCRVLHRVGGTRCQRCTQRVATPRYNLAVRHPAIAAEWHPTANGPVRPEDLTPASSLEVWWRCRLCGHEWATPVSARTISKHGCARCVLVGTSRPETYLRHELTAFFGESVDSLIVPTAVRRYHVDVTIVRGRRKIAIEYDGSYHHAPNEARDRRKTRALEAAGWTVIRVRPAPLRRITRDDVRVGRSATIYEMVVAVLLRLAEIGMPARGLAGYQASGCLRAAETAERELAAHRAIRAARRSA